MFVQTFQAFAAVSVAASGGTADYEFSGNVRRCRVVGESAGADISLALQSSVNGGVTWHDVATYAAGSAVGAQAVEELCDAALRLRATNANAISAQNVSASVVLQSD